jgi:hypothetical protein
MGLTDINVAAQRPRVVSPFDYIPLRLTLTFIYFLVSIYITDSWLPVRG